MDEIRKRPRTPPTAPASLLLSPRSRRGSIASVATAAHLDKEQLSDRLDKIHTDASRSGNLTSFNDFAPPPPAQTSPKGKVTTGDMVQQSLGGLYSRLKGAVGVVTAVEGSPHQLQEQSTAYRKPEAASPTIVNPSPSAAPTRIKTVGKVTAQSNVPVIISTPTDQHDALAEGLTPSSIDNTKTREPGTHDSVAQETRLENFQSRINPPFMSQGSSGDHMTVDRTHARKSTPESVNAFVNQPFTPAEEKATVNPPPPSSRTESPAVFNRKPVVIDRLTRASMNGPQSRSSSIDTNALAPASMTISAQSSTGQQSPAPSNRGEQLGSNMLGQVADRSRSNVLLGAPISRLEAMRKQVLSKEFWMADETTRECFLCGTAFSAFRRKHHCRTCGCIFDSKCTATISGQQFGVSGSLRVCKTCLDVINRRHESDSEGSEDDSYLPRLLRPRQSKSSRSSRTDLADTASIAEMTEEQMHDRHATTPMMAIPATRRIATGPHNRKSAILEIEAPQLSRPSSSRSLKSLANGRPQSSGHRRLQSRNSLFGRLKAAPTQEAAPFRRGAEGEDDARLPAFHDDNIIDPELAPYMSDESSGDEQMSIFSTLNHDDLASPRGDGEANNLSSLVSSHRKHRSRQAGKSISGLSQLGRGLDDMHPMNSLDSPFRPMRRRNFSTTSHTTAYMRSPRPKSGVFPRNFDMSSESLIFPEGAVEPSSGRLTRSSSTRRPSRPPIVFNTQSLEHIAQLFRQLLAASKIAQAPMWEKALTPILLRCASDVDPDSHLGDLMDVRHYVKIKKVPGGKPADTAYISGVIFSKNLALKSMPRKISDAKVIIVTFALEYVRTQQQHFMSLEPVVEQERSFLRNVVGRILKLRPTVLIAQKAVSGLALQYLSDAGIAVVYNVKEAVVEAVARCTKADILSSLDMLTMPSSLGFASRFEVKTFVSDEFAGRKKTCIVISGCDRALGCTIALRGADTTILRRLKRIIEFMAYVAYSAKLETSLLMDQQLVAQPARQSPAPEGPSSQTTAADTASQLSFDTAGASMPASNSTADNDSVTDSSVVLASPRQSMDETRSLSASSTPELAQGTTPQQEAPSQVAIDVDNLQNTSMPTYYSDIVAKYRTRILSASPFVKFDEPYLLVRAREQERRLEHLRRLRDQDKVEEQADAEKIKPQRFHVIKPEMVNQFGQNGPRQIMEVLHAVHDAEYDKAMYNYKTQTKQWEHYFAGGMDLFDPYAHQNIVVLYSVICTETKVPCLEPALIAFGFYQDNPSDSMDPDCPLRQYIEDLCGNADAICHSNGCEHPLSQHHRTYVHDKARITVFVEKGRSLPFDPTTLIGEDALDLEDSIFVWDYCKVCKRDMAFAALSDTAKKYSFGKYLELSFWGHDLALSPDLECTHDRRIDHVRYFSYRGVTIRMHHDPIDLLEIVVPRARITWKVELDLRLKNEIFSRCEDRWTRYMKSVRARLKSIRIDSVLPDKAEACRKEVDNLTEKAKDDQAYILRELQKTYMHSKYYEILPFNAVVRHMMEKVAAWDTAFAKFEADFLPDKDIRQLTLLQLRKMFADNDSKESLQTSTEGTSITSADMDEKSTLASTQASLPEAEEPTLAEEERPKDGHELIEESAAVVINSSVTEMQSHDDAATANTSGDISGADGSRPQAEVEDTPQITTAADAEEATPNETEQSKTALADTLAADAKSAEQPGSKNALSERIEHYRKQHELVDNEDRGRTGSDTPPNATKAAPRDPSRVDDQPNKLTRVASNSMRTNSRSQSRFGRATATKDMNEHHSSTVSDDRLPQTLDKSDKKLSDRFGLSAFKHKKGMQSSIPRYVHGKKKQSKVSSLARHFEQLSKEFEKERLRDRNKRAARLPPPRMFLPRSSTRAIVEVYDDVEQAVHEADPTDDDASIQHGQSARPSLDMPATADNKDAHQMKTDQTSLQTAENATSNTATTQAPATGDIGAEDKKASEQNEPVDEAPSDADDSALDDFFPDVQAIAESLEIDEDLTNDLQKDPKSGLMKMLTNFWAERSASGWSVLDYPSNVTDHIFVDSNVIVREDEPSSLIAFALGSEDYQAKLAHIRHQWKANNRKSPRSSGSVLADAAEPALTASESSDALATQGDLEQSLLRSTGTHLKYQFSEGSAKMLCKIFYAEQFDALRRKCGVADRIVESLSRCMKWDSKGGKTKSVFLKTLDDRLIMKSLSPVETTAFLRFAPAYFSIMAEALFHELPSVIAKMLGFYQVIIKNTTTNTEIKLDFLVMENLFYDRTPSRIFDLKGSMRNRKIESTGEQNEVLLDENMVEYIYESPLFAREHAKKVLRASVWNDTLFLARQNVMDYSLMVAVDESKKELVVGIIDCIRTYTWDKRLESWIKDRGLAGGGRNRPTVTSPKEYKSRFREAMARYILQSPNCWHHFGGLAGNGANGREGREARFEEGI